MFLKELYRFCKKRFYLFLLFIGLTFLINYKSGAVITPINIYGMFSGGFKLSDTQAVYRLVVNDSLLDYSKLTYVQRDLLLNFASKYENEDVWNKTTLATMKNVFNKVGLGSLMTNDKYLNNVDDLTFTNWYKKHIEKIVGYPVSTIELYKYKYIWDTQELVEVGLPEKQRFIVTN
jgi:hypothetical protein